MNNRTFGDEGEEIAVNHLVNNGYRIHRRNYRFGRLGEIDIVASHGEYICFVEVKTRTSILFGMPSESVTWKKQKVIRKIASLYISQNKLFASNIRFDIVEIIGSRVDGSFEAESINVIQNAF